MKNLFIVILFFSVSLLAQSADEIIENVQKKFDEIENLKADFNQEISSSNSFGTVKFSGKFYFQKEKSFRIELPARVIISDGKTIWNYDEKQNKVIISEAGSDDISFSLTEIIYTYPNNCNLTLIEKNKKGYKIKALPKDDELNFKEAILEISTNFILNKITILDFNNMKYSFELLSIQLNKPIDINVFSFIPTDEVEVIDLR